MSGIDEGSLDKSWTKLGSYSTNKSLWAVKLSYCLSEWRKLGDVFKPALMEFRNNLYSRKERLEDGEDDVWLFLEFNAFCEIDGKEDEAIELFMQFHNGKSKDFAKAIFPQIQYQLLKNGYYKVCNEYVKDPIQAFNRIRVFCDLDQVTFNRDVIFILTVLKENNRDIEYKQLKNMLTGHYTNEKLTEKINDLER